MASHGGRIRLAADIGGTFTDIVLEAGGRLETLKVLTTPDAPERAVVEGAGQVLDAAGLGFSDIDVFLHGTTLATNAVIERKGAKTGLIATQGFRDVIAIADESRYDQYDVFIEKPEPPSSQSSVNQRSGSRVMAFSKAAMVQMPRGSTDSSPSR